MFDRIKSFAKKVVQVVGGAVAGVSALVMGTSRKAEAALSAADQTSILAGITASDTVFYAIGGGILVVMAGIWGFRKVKALLGA